MNGDQPGRILGRSVAPALLQVSVDEAADLHQH